MILNPERKLKQVREYKNYTQEYIALQLGISTRAYSKIETGETQLTFTRFYEICKILETDPLFILNFSGENIFQNNTSAVKVNSNEDYLIEKLIKQYEITIETLREQINLMKSV